MSADTPPRYETAAAIDRLDDLLGFSGGNSSDTPDMPPSQDWDLLLADPARLSEFCDLYESEELDADTKFALMRLIVASLDDLIREESTEGANADMAGRVEGLLRQDFVLNLHTLDYWCLHDEPDPQNVFPVTLLLRRIWQECYQSDYGRWLAVDENTVRAVD